MKKCFLLSAALAVTMLSVQNTAAQNGAPYWSLSGNNNATLANKIGTTNAVSLRFVTNNTERMKILSTGNVGIGTASPTYKLSVNGTIQAKEVRVETGWADYVFDKAYRLRPLTEVEQFIKQYNHLPGIASASDVQRHGLALGETQTKMMEKIEELTLYIIDLQRQIEQLQKNQNSNK